MVMPSGGVTRGGAVDATGRILKATLRKPNVNQIPSIITASRYVNCAVDWPFISLMDEYFERISEVSRSYILGIDTI